jgi:outer membrane protein OmpA-like peptidoglycan-associated protein
MVRDATLAHRFARIATIALLILGVATAGCVPTERIVLLPEKDGRPTAVTVKQRDRQIVLDKPYDAATLTIADPWRYNATPAEIDGTFGAALAARPERATHYTLYFVEGSDELTEDSKAVFERVFTDLASRKVPDIVVVGHTDAVGSDKFNDELARKRADAVRTALVRRGIAEADVVAIGRGKRELLVPTPDGIAEPRNRRVEIVVR